MYEFLDGLHKALHIESTWKFVLLIAGAGALIFGVVAWVIDASYENSPEYREAHSLSPKGPGATVVDMPVAPKLAPIPTSAASVKDTHKTHKMVPVANGVASPLPYIGNNNTLVNPSYIPRMGDGNTIVGLTDANGNTIINKGGTAIGSGACADSTSIAIGAGALAGNCKNSMPPLTPVQ